MKKLSKPVLIGAAALLAAATMAGCAGEKPVEVQTNPTAVSDAQKSVKVTNPKSMIVDKNFQTGWTQLENSIEVSLSGPDNCLPQIDHATRDGKTVSIWLKDVGDDCTNTTAVVYNTIEDAKNIEKVQVYEAGYKMPFELFELAKK